MKAVDMSPAAIAARLAEVNALNRLCDSLGRAGRSLAVASSSRSYEDELHAVLELGAVEASCSAAAAAVQLLLRPSFAPEVCITLTTGQGGSVLDVRTFDRSVWAYWNARTGQAGFGRIRNWVRPHLSVETIHDVPVRAEVFRAEAPWVPPGQITLDGLPYTFTFWLAGKPTAFGRNTIAPAEVLGLVEAAAGLVRWERSKAALHELRLYWPELDIATPGRLL